MALDSRYPDADILAQRGHWDAATRDVVLDRVHNVPEFEFFTPAERRTLEVVCERVLPQSERPTDRRIPIAPWIDQRCVHAITEGFRYDDMPPTPQAWRQGLAGLDQTARALAGADFVDLASTEQDRVLETIRAGTPPGDVWHQMPARRWWITFALRQITGVYYAHPYAWDEIGFGGPAYPRGYFALNHGYPEPWEAREVGQGTSRELLPRGRFP
ncbi:MAG: gluconate 2-dehydrogenase subunit 3 family protein [Chloroflexi bacterium]|nr:gluconate 2-dehydrogenase subunit 3 family protein [Chloroflexota bacterium]